MTTGNMHMDCDGFADALADYLEDDASEGVRQAMDAHAASCPACAQLLADLGAISTEASRLPRLTPSRDLWSGIAERIDARVLPMDAPRAAVRRSWIRPALAAAALVVITAGVTHYLTRASLAVPATSRVAEARTAAPEATTPDATGSIASTATESPAVAHPSASKAHASSTAGRAPVSRPRTSLRLASTAPLVEAGEPVFASEITKLRRIVRERRSQLDPKTIAVLEQSIAVMDSAIAQSRAALLKDPASGFLATQLNHSLEKKVELLRTAALLPSRT
jgi:hypothetical protein